MILISLIKYHIWTCKEIYCLQNLEYEFNHEPMSIMIKETFDMMQKLYIRPKALLTIWQNRFFLCFLRLITNLQMSNKYYNNYNFNI